MIVKMYENYGVLAHEYTPVYAYVPGEVSDQVSVDIPDEYKPYETEAGTICVTVKIRGEEVKADLAEALNHLGIAKKCNIEKIA